MMTRIIDIQNLNHRARALQDRITQLENLVKDQNKQICDLVETLQSQGMVLSYLTDENFREFAFKLNYNRLISEFLETNLGVLNGCDIR